MAYIEYRSTDSGAPTLNGTSGSLIALLDACLVNGYGSKSAAGWTKEYAATNKAVYRPSHGNRYYLRVLDDGSDGTNGARVARVRGYETMSDVDTGTGPFPTDAQVSGGLFIGKSSTADSTARTWVLLADGKRFVLFVAYHASSLGAYAQNYFGDLGGVSAADIYATMLSAANTSANAVAFAVGNSTGSSSLVTGLGGAATGYFPRIRTGTGTSSQARTYATNGTSGTSGMTAGPDSSGNVWADPVTVNDDTAASAPRGYIPGVLFMRHYLDGSYSTFAAIGTRYVMRYAASGASAFLVDPDAGGNAV